jgi:hypothetical protein
MIDCCVQFAPLLCVGQLVRATKIEPLPFVVVKNLRGYLDAGNGICHMFNSLANVFLK